MREDGRIDYVEFGAGDLVPLKRFYAEAFGWTFTDYGPSYAAFNEGLDGGFDADAGSAGRRPLVILYAHDLEAMEAKVRAAAAPSPSPSSASPAAAASTSPTPPATNWRCGAKDRR